MTCPRCGFAEAAGPACARCGVVFAKVRERPPSSRPTPSSPTAASWALIVVPVVVLVAGIAALGHWRRASHAPPRPAPDASRIEPSRAEPVRHTAEELPPVVQIPLDEAPMPPADLARAGMSDADLKQLADLAAILSKHQPIIAADVDAAAALQARHPEVPVLQGLVLNLMLGLGNRLAEERRFAEGLAVARRAVSLPWADARPRTLVLNLLLASSDWPAVEAQATENLRLIPGDSAACHALGYALMRQDRNREAIEALKRCDGGSAGRALLARLEKGQKDESGMTERRISHFQVRYDGGEHEAIGREVLRVLERDYATLAGTMDDEPRVAIPVILFSEAQYYDASGAPAWSGGSYDHTDGRIRVPIGGLSPGLSAEVESTLLHELTHAFITDKSEGVAPREIQEGLAQYMEGKRIESSLPAEGRAALARGGIEGVGGFYLQALSMVEYLMAVRGQGGMNDLLKAMAQTHSVDQAFQQVHGQSYAAVQKAWRQRLQQQYGG